MLLLASLFWVLFAKQLKDRIELNVGSRGRIVMVRKE